MIRRSVAGSTALVASSRISSPGWSICARASETSCRSPTDSASPRSPTARVEAVGQRRHPVGEPELLERGLDVAVGRARPAVPHVLAHRRVEQEPVLGHHPDRARRDVGATSRRSTPSTSIRPSAGRPGAPGASRTSSCRSRSRRRSRRALPASTSSDDAVEHRAALPVASIARRSTRTASAPLRQLDAGLPARRSRRQVEHREDLPPARDRGLRLGVDLGQVGEHVQEESARKMNAVTRPNVSPHSGPKMAPSDHDRRDGDRVEHRREREQRGRAPVRDDLRPVALVDRALHADGRSGLSSP